MKALRFLILALLFGALSGCLASWPTLPWLDGPIADASTPHVIYFDRDAYKVDDRYRPMLAAHARRMNNAPRLRLLIRATTDAVGASDYNLALSRKRAETVMKGLMAFGVPRERMEIAGLGEVHRAPAGADRDSHGPARRVELIYR